VIHPVAADEQVSTVYEVSVNGQRVPVVKDNTRSYAHFSFAGTADIKVTVNEPVSKYHISPKGFDIRSVVNGNQIAFQLKVPRYLFLWGVNNQKEKLFILANPLEENPPKLGDAGVRNIMDYGVDLTGSRISREQIQMAIDEASAGKGTLYFPAGVYLIDDSLMMKSDTTIYLAGGAYLRRQGRRPILNFDNASDVKVVGRGVLDGNGGGTVILGKDSSDVLLEGIIIQRNPGGFTTWPLNPTNWTFRNLKLVGDVGRAGNDGLNFDGGQGILLYDNFVYSGDDCTSPKIYGNKITELQRPSYRINTVHFVGWNNSSGAGIKTFEAYGDNSVLSDLTYENVDIVHSATDAGIAFYAVGGGGVENVWLKNVRVEQLANKDARDHRPFIFACIDWNPWGPLDPAYIRNVCFQNVYFEDMGSRKSEMRGRGEKHLVSEIVFDRLVMGGELKTSLEHANIEVVGPVKYVAFRNTERQLVSIKAVRMYADHSGCEGIVEISRAGPNDSGLTIPLTIGGTAQNGKDYELLPDSVTIPANSYGITLKVVPLSDKIDDGGKSVVIALRNKPCSVDYLLTPDWRAVVVIAGVRGRPGGANISSR
jgi:hypothetical protein